MPAGSAAVGGFGPAGGARPAGGFVRPGSRTGFPTGRGAFPTGRGAFPTGRGGFPARGALSANSALSALLKSTTTTWAAATVGSQVAAPLELASGKAVMAIGGFNGGDAAPTLAEFEHYVQAGKIRYFIAGGVGGGQGGVGGPGGAVGGQGTGTAIEQWVAAHYTATTVGGMTVYDLAG
jgi:hypothetical protein